MKTTAEEIRKAEEALKTSGIVNNGNYDSVFKGYISGFGASLVQAGLLPTVIFYESGSDEARDRKNLVDALKVMLGINTEQLARFILERGMANDQTFINKVAQAMVALKLALRMNNKIEKNNG